MGQFNCIAALDQVIGYCATSVRKKDQPCLGIVTLWEIHVCNKLPQGVKTEADFYQREMTNLNEGLDYVKVLLDDTGILRKGDFVQHKRAQSRPKEMTIVVANERAEKQTSI